MSGSCRALTFFVVALAITAGGGYVLGANCNNCGNCLLVNQFEVKTTGGTTVRFLSYTNNAKSVPANQAFSGSNNQNGSNTYYLNGSCGKGNAVDTDPVVNLKYYYLAAGDITYSCDANPNAPYVRELSCLQGAFYALIPQAICPDS